MRLLVLAGDGIGPEITAATLIVLKAAIHRFRLDARAANCLSDSLRTELRRRKGSKSTLKFSNGGTNSTEDDGLVHE